MAEGYYYSRKQYLKNLNDRLENQAVYDRLMEGLSGVSNIPKKPEVTSLKELLTDQTALKAFVLNDLKTYMLANDAAAVLEYLVNDDSLGLYAESSNNWKKFIGNPSVYAPDSFIKNWATFKLGKDLVLPRTADERRLADLELAELAEREGLTESFARGRSEIKKREKERTDVATKKIRKAIEKYKEAAEKNKEAIERNRLLRLARKTVLPEELSESPSVGPSVATTIHSDAQNREFHEYFSKAKQLLDSREPGKKAKFSSPFTIPEMSKKLAEFAGTKVNTQLNTHERISPVIDSAINALESSGHGLSKKKIRPSKDKQMRVRILEGELRAGQNNPMVKKELRKIKFN